MKIFMFYITNTLTQFYLTSILCFFIHIFQINITKPANFENL